MGRSIKSLLVGTVAWLSCCNAIGAELPPEAELALRPAPILLNPWAKHIPPTNRQGVPGHRADGRRNHKAAMFGEQPRNRSARGFDFRRSSTG